MKNGRNENVTVLNMRYVSVKNLPLGVDEKFPNLIKYLATGCGIKVLNPLSFMGLSDLGELDLNDNQLTSINSGDFQYLSSLKVLTLSNNQISQISNDGFDPLIKLENLFLEKNKVKILNFKIDALSELYVLRFGVNQIEILPGHFFKNNTKLQYLFLSKNNIQIVPHEIFDGLPLLQYVDLHDNKCISGTYNENQFMGLKDDLKNNCTLML